MGSGYVGRFSGRGRPAAHAGAVLCGIGGAKAGNILGKGETRR